MQQNQKSSAIIVAQNDNTKQQEVQATKPDDTQAVTFSEVFRFADKYDYAMMIFGSLGAAGVGAATPIFILFWGQITNVFDQSADSIVNAAFAVFLKFIYLGAGTLVAAWAMVTLWGITGQRQSSACKKAYFSALLKQEIGWFDCINQSQLSSDFSADTITYEGATGEKVGILIQVVGLFIGSFVVAFVQGWLMTLVTLVAIPLLTITGYLWVMAIQAKEKEYQKFYSEAGGRAEQAISSIKTVKQLNGQLYEQNQYIRCLGDISKNSLQFGLKTAICMGVMYGCMFLVYSLTFWFGSHCAQGSSVCPPSVSGKYYQAGDVLTIFFCVLAACFNLGQLSPAFKKIGEGKQAAARIFKIIDREPLIKSPINGAKPQKFVGHIKFEEVTFFYPKDKTKKILDNLTIEFHINNTALVGQSGCGKSTILQLVMRFYDPDSGKITLDGYDLRELDLTWLRSQIGYVGQEPVLFADTIRANLLLGNQNASEEDLKHALEQAEAYQFIFTQLEQKLETFVGSGGGQISGGQKQRIAIARALLKKPKILLLDEATSALDRRNERLIQNTLNKVSQGLTTITVAHRVQSIMGANIIYVINKGKIQEKGKFHQLERYKNFENKEKDEDIQHEIKDGKFIKKQMIVDEKRQGKNVENSKPSEDKLIKQQLLSKYEQKSIYGRIFSYNKDHVGTFIVGLLMTVINGVIYPIFSIFLGTILNALFQFSSPSTVSDARSKSNTAALVFLILAFGGFIINFLRNLFSSIVGQEITNNIRKECFSKILKMPIPWFDQPSHHSGTLASRLGTDCMTVNGLTTTYIYIFVDSISTLLAGMIIALIYEWRTALVAIGMIPFLMVAGAIRSAYRTGLGKKTDEAGKKAANTIMQSLTNIRTVVSFGVENTVMHRYEDMLNTTEQSVVKTGLVTGFLFGFSQIAMYMIMGLIFFIGAIFVQKFNVSIQGVFVASFAILFSAMTAGNNAHFMPDANQGKMAAASIFEILDSQDEDQMQVRQSSRLLKSGIAGNIKIQNVSFKYETRNQYVFKNMNLEIKRGQKIAFVGPSGCGKSTIMQLLQRMYFFDEGKIFIDGNDIKDYDIHYLRSRFGVVSQEPTLFNGTFRENIKYNKQDVGEQQIRLAAREANALSFIEGDEQLDEDHTNPKVLEKGNRGFDKNVGIKGSHISGGQKQRIAIARALLRSPEILLLDEATSALDNQNEKKVQESLDRIMQNKTTISIAHRIDTIKNSDEINVFEKGQIVERGTYEQLMEKKGFFFNLERGTQFI